MKLTAKGGKCASTEQIPLAGEMIRLKTTTKIPMASRVFPEEYISIQDKDGELRYW